MKKFLSFFFWGGLVGCPTPDFPKLEGSLYQEKIDKIYVVNLARSTDRLVFMENQLRQLGLEFEPFMAVDGKQLDLKELRKKGILQYWPESWDWLFAPQHLLSAGEVGCYLSHQNLVSKMVRERQEVVMVLEDDVQLVPDFKQNLNGLFACAPADWDIIFLGCNKAHIYGCLSPFGLGSQELCAGHLERVKDCTPGTYAYLLSKQGAKKLARFALPLAIPIDELIARHLASGQFGVFKAYCTNPELVYPAENFQSEIDTIGGRG